MAFTVSLSAIAVQDLRNIRSFDRRRIIDEVDRQLQHQPTVETRNRKQLGALAVGFEHEGPIWELRVGEYRVFYDVDVSTSTVHVRTIRRKELHQTTEEITNDASDD